MLQGAMSWWEQPELAPLDPVARLLVQVGDLEGFQAVRQGAASEAAWDNLKEAWSKAFSFAEPEVRRVVLEAARVDEQPLAAAVATAGSSAASSQPAPSMQGSAPAVRLQPALPPRAVKPALAPGQAERPGPLGPEAMATSAARGRLPRELPSSPAAPVAWPPLGVAAASRLAAMPPAWVGVLDRFDVDWSARQALELLSSRGEDGRKAANDVLWKLLKKSAWENDELSSAQSALQGNALGGVSSVAPLAHMWGT